MATPYEDVLAAGDGATEARLHLETQADVRAAMAAEEALAASVLEEEIDNPPEHNLGRDQWWQSIKWLPLQGLLFVLVVVGLAWGYFKYYSPFNHQWAEIGFYWVTTIALWIYLREILCGRLRELYLQWLQFMIKLADDQVSSEGKLKALMAYFGVIKYLLPTFFVKAEPFKQKVSIQGQEDLITRFLQPLLQAVAMLLHILRKKVEDPQTKNRLGHEIERLKNTGVGHDLWRSRHRQSIFWTLLILFCVAFYTAAKTVFTVMFHMHGASESTAGAVAVLAGLIVGWKFVSVSLSTWYARSDELKQN